jgi:hypothetical protein
METDARKIAHGGKWRYIGSQPKSKREIQVEIAFHAAWTLEIGGGQAIWLEAQ